jgi:hypothetical protein
MIYSHVDKEDGTKNERIILGEEKQVRAMIKG